jgi:hypothetical protein
VARSQSTVAVEHSRSHISIQHYNMSESATDCECVKIELYGFEASFYSRCCMETSENSTSTYLGE